MAHVPRGAPFAERGGRLRAVVDVVAGRYPPFVFGLGVGSALPVFHFHETTRDRLEPAFRYLRDNAYQTVRSDTVAAYVRHGRRPPPRAVMLAFDDALASLWLVVGPLLKEYGLSAVAYAIPGRIAEAERTRPTMTDGPVDAAAADRAPNPFVTWPELQALSTSGLIDVQSHTWSHSMIFSADRPLGVVTPDMAAEFVLSWPRTNVDDPPAYLDPARLGQPLFARRSRMSDARRFLPDTPAADAVEALVSAEGGAAFFARTDWSTEVRGPLQAVTGRWETETERLRAIDHELVAARETLEHRLGTPVRHVCLPWGVSGQTTSERLEALGFETAFANRLPGQFAVHAGDPPFFLKRLAHRYLFALPGRGRSLATFR